MTCCTKTAAGTVVGTVATVCPVCLERVSGRLLRAGDEVRLERRCPEHGATRALIWRGPPDYEAWRSAGSGAVVEPPAGCPTTCGVCSEHAQGVCCVLLEVTRGCDLACSVCYASAGSGSGSGDDADPSLAEVESWYRKLARAAPRCNVQLSGGEPTTRDDLPAIVALGRDHGFGFIQLNTNGLRLAREPGYAEELAAAGLKTVFLQFDGLDDEPYVTLRGMPLADTKRRAVEACGRAGLGVVLVPTVAAGVNLGDLGAILEFALEGLPVVRGVHVQPLANLGRYGARFRPDDAERVTLPDVMRALVEQSGGRIALDDFKPGDCEHALCSFQAEYLKQPDGRLVRLRREEPSSCCGTGTDSGTEPSSRCATEPACNEQSSSCCGAGPDSGERSGASGPDQAGGCCSGQAATSGAEGALAPERKAALVARRWSGRRDAVGRAADESAGGSPAAGTAGPAGEWEDILRRVSENTFSLSGMAFQDAWTLDLERLCHCYLHVMRRDGVLLPFCAFNLTDTQGRGLPGGRP